MHAAPYASINNAQLQYETSVLTRRKWHHWVCIESSIIRKPSIFPFQSWITTIGTYLYWYYNMQKGE